MEPRPGWERVKEIFEGASACDESDRIEFLNEACAGDQDLRGQVEHLLAHHKPAFDFLEHPLVRLPALHLSSQPSHQVFVPDQIINHRFRIVRHLASGGMGEVYRATDLELHRDVAVKVVRNRLAHDPERIARLRQEGLATARLNHPNILTLFEIGQHEEILYVVTELLIGETLRVRLTPEGLPLRNALRWATEIARGLEAAHKEGIVHRDLKPENVFVTHDDRVKLLDFGLATLLSGQSLSPDPRTEVVDTAPFTVFGTPAYMAPEQVAGHSVDHRADIFAFGVILSEMLSGRRPHSHQDIRTTARSSWRLRALLRRCMAPHPKDRFQSTSDLVTALDRATRGFPLRRALALATGSMLVAVTASLSATWLSSVLWSPAHLDQGRVTDAALSRSTFAVLPIVNLSGDPHTEQVSEGVTSTIVHNIATLSGLTVASQADTARYLIGERSVASALNDLGVSLLLDLGLERTPAGFRLHGALHRAGTALPVWTGSYSGDVLAIQRAILEGLPQLLATGGFTGTVTAADRARLIRMPTASANALLEYFEGRRLLARPHAKTDVEDATAAFQRALEQDPDFVMALTSLSEAYSLRYQKTRDAVWLEKAAHTAGRALSLDATDASAHVALAKVKQQTGELAEAIREARLAVQLVPDSDGGHRLLGLLLADSGKSIEAVNELERAVSLRPNFWTNHYTLGYVRYMAGRYDEAIPSFLRVTHLQPNYPGGYVILGASYHRTGAIDLAIGHYEHAARLGPSSTAYANLGLIYYVDGRFDDALSSYRTALDHDPLSATLWRSIGDVYSKLNRHGDAVASYKHAIALSERQLAVNPRDALTLALVALCEAKLGHRSNAMRRASEAFALAQNDREVLFNRASTYAILRQPDKALTALRSALAHGYEPALARSDADLESLRSSPEFNRLLGGDTVLPVAQ